MNKKSRILFLIGTFFVIFFINIKDVMAEENVCYYYSDELMVRIGSDGRSFSGYVDGIGSTGIPPHGLIVKNAYNDVKLWYLGEKIPKKFKSNNDFKKALANNNCPKYVTIVLLEQRFLGIDWWFFSGGYLYDFYIFDSEAEAMDFEKNKVTKYDTGMFSNWTFTQTYLINGIFHAPNVSSSAYWTGYAPKDYRSSKPSAIGCELIDDNIKRIINEILSYVRVIVPVMIIALGMYEFAKAMASNEDEIKKAQKRFIQRLLIGVAVFLIPVFVNIIFNIAETIWQGTGLYSCTIDGKEVGTSQSHNNN